MAINHRFLKGFAQGIKRGLTATEAYHRLRPNCTEGTARSNASKLIRRPEYFAVRKALIEGADSSGILTKDEIRRALTLAVTTPKDIDSLMLPQNRWLITGSSRSSTEKGESVSVRSVSPLAALEALAKLDGHYALPESGPEGSHEGLSELEKSPLYAEMLEQEARIARAKWGKVTEVEVTMETTVETETITATVTTTETSETQGDDDEAAFIAGLK